MKIDIVIPNYNGSHLIEKNLPKVIESHNNYQGKIILVDDGSNIQDKENLRSLVERLSSKKVELVEHAKNKGFSSAINTGVKHSASEFVVLLNSDVIPESDFLKPLLLIMEDDSMFGVGCCDKSYENGQFVRRGRGIGYWKNGMLLHKRGEIDKKDTFWISGGSCIIRRELFERLGGMDTLYNPFYWEDIDLSYRARKAGYNIEFCKDSIVEHYHGEGAILKGFKKGKITITAYRNQFIFIWKNITSQSLLVNHALHLPLIVLGSIKDGNFAMIKGLFLALLKLPAIMNRRKKQAKLYALSDLKLLDYIS